MTINCLSVRPLDCQNVIPLTVFWAMIVPFKIGIPETLPLTVCKFPLKGSLSMRLHCTSTLQATDRGAAAQDFAEGSGEVDPLDAFMAENDKQIDVGAEGGGEEEIDPLDAFMAGIAPTVRQDMAATTEGDTTNGPTVEIKMEEGTTKHGAQVCFH